VSGPDGRHGHPEHASARRLDETPLVGPDPGVGGELRVDRYVGDNDLTHWYTPAGRMLARVVQAFAARTGPYTAFIIILLVGAAIAFALSAAAVQIYDAVADGDGIAGLDQPLLEFALTLRSPAADMIVTGYTDIAGTIGMPIIAVVTMVILALHRRSWTPVVLIVAAGGGSLLMTIAGKDLIGRERPPLVDAVPPYEFSPSFPSGHTLNAVVVVGIIAYLLILRRRTRAARVGIAAGAVLFALTVGLSRVFLGHHWFTDVLAGWVLGAAWLALIITAHRLYLTTRKKEQPALPAPSPDASRSGSPGPVE
jgi:undecaprenyl-diphosphatase